MKKFGHYEVTAELGRGGMGVVYKGWEPSLNREVAIKCLGEHLLNDKDLIERFIREAKATAALNNPNVIQIYFIGEEEGQPFFAMEFIEGQSLDDILKGGNAFSVKHAKNILRQASLGLAAAHAKDLVHRDIKPANLMLTNEGILKVVDFGIARTREYGDKLTNTGEFVGTPGYLSPEVCIGKEVDLRSDIFSLGIVFYEMLAGKVPFENDSPLGLMLEVVQSDIPDIRSLNNKVDRKTSFILNKMIAKSPEDRYQTCDEIIRDLGNTIENETISSIQKQTTTLKKQPIKKPASEQITLPGSEAITAHNLTLQPKAKKSKGKVKFLVAASLFTLIAVAGVGHFAGVFPEIGAETDKVALVDENLLPQLESSSEINNLHEGQRQIDTPSQQESYAQAEENIVDKSEPLTTQPSLTLFAEEKDEKTVLSDSTKIDFSDSKVVAQNQITSSTAQVEAETAKTPTKESVGSNTDQQIVVEDKIQLPAEVELNQVAISTPQQSVLETKTQIPPAAIETTKSIVQQATSQVKQHVAQPVQKIVKQPVITKAPKKRYVALNKGVVVIAFGDPAIANPVEKILEGELKNKGIKVMNEQFIPGMRQLVENGLDLAELKKLIQSNGGQAMVIANVNYVGSQQLTYAGRSSELINAQLDIDTYDVKTGDSIGSGFGSKLSYTSLNATDEATDAVMPYTGELSQSLKGKI